MSSYLLLADVYGEFLKQDLFIEKLIIPGAGLEELVSQGLSKLRRLPQHTVVLIIAGNSDLLRKYQINDRGVLELAANPLSLLQSKIEWAERVIIQSGGIPSWVVPPPVSLFNYHRHQGWRNDDGSIFTVGYLLEQEQLFMKNLCRLGEICQEHNRRNQVPTLDLSELVMNVQGGNMCLNESLLSPSGILPTYDLAQIWNEKLQILFACPIQPSTSYDDRLKKLADLGAVGYDDFTHSDGGAGALLQRFKSLLPTPQSSTDHRYLPTPSISRGQNKNKNKSQNAGNPGSSYHASCQNTTVLPRESALPPKSHKRRQSSSSTIDPVRLSIDVNPKPDDEINHGRRNEVVQQPYEVAWMSITGMPEEMSTSSAGAVSTTTSKLHQRLDELNPTPSDPKLAKKMKKKLKFLELKNRRKKHRQQALTALKGHPEKPLPGNPKDFPRKASTTDAPDKPDSQHNLRAESRLPRYVEQNIDEIIPIKQKKGREHCKGVQGAREEFKSAPRANPQHSTYKELVVSVVGENPSVQYVSVRSMAALKMQEILMNRVLKFNQELRLLMDRRPLLIQDLLDANLYSDLHKNPPLSSFTVNTNSELPHRSAGKKRKKDDQTTAHVNVATKIPGPKRKKHKKTNSPHLSRSKPVLDPATTTTAPATATGPSTTPATATINEIPPAATDTKDSTLTEGPSATTCSTTTTTSPTATTTSHIAATDPTVKIGFGVTTGFTAPMDIMATTTTTNSATADTLIAAADCTNESSETYTQFAGNFNFTVLDEVGLSESEEEQNISCSKQDCPDETKPHFILLDETTSSIEESLTHIVKQPSLSEDSAGTFHQEHSVGQARCGSIMSLVPQSSTTTDGASAVKEDMSDDTNSDAKLSTDIIHMMIPDTVEKEAVQQQNGQSSAEIVSEDRFYDDPYVKPW